MTSSKVTLGRGKRAAPAKPVTAKRAPAKPRRKPETPTVTDDLTGKFLRVGNKLYRTSDDKQPFAKLEPDRLKTNNIDALPDIVRLAKANGWTSIRINGGDKLQNARDPELRRAQTLVAQAVSIARARYPDDPVEASKDVEAKRQQVANRIANGDKIAAIQIRNQQAQRAREVTQDQALKRGDRSR